MGGQSVEVMSLLSADPDLAAGVPREELRIARARTVGEVLRLPVGPWAPAPELRREAPLGLLIVDGLLTRRITVAGRASVELLGAGEVLMPWQDDGGPLSMVEEMQWRIVDPVRAIKLGRAVERSLARWPQLYRNLQARSARRSQALGIVIAISQVPQVHARLMLLFWHLAERWGKVAPGNIVVSIDVPQQTLGELVHADRSSVNRALRRLRGEGLLARGPGGWVICTDPANPSLWGSCASSALLLRSPIAALSLELEVEVDEPEVPTALFGLSAVTLVTVRQGEGVA
jgi:hypothetical protein